MCTSHCSVCVFKGKLWSLSRSLSCLHLFYYKLIRHEFSLYVFTFMLSGLVHPLTHCILEFPQCFYSTRFKFHCCWGCHYFITFQLFLSLPSFLISCVLSDIFLEMYVFFCLYYSLFHGEYMKWETGSTIEIEWRNFQETGCSTIKQSFLVFFYRKISCCIVCQGTAGPLLMFHNPVIYKH